MPEARFAKPADIPTHLRGLLCLPAGETLPESIPACFQRRESVAELFNAFRIHCVFCAGGQMADFAQCMNRFSSEYCFIAEASVRKREMSRVPMLDLVVESYKEQLDGKRILLKMATQTQSPDAKEEGQKYLDRVFSIKTELPFHQMFDETADFADVPPAPKQSGFRATGFFPFHLDGDLGLIELDCILTPEEAPLGLAN
jgi:hypothetical protein